MLGFDETVTSAVEKVILSVVNISEVKLIKDAHLQVHPVPGGGFGVHNRFKWLHPDQCSCGAWLLRYQGDAGERQVLPCTSEGHGHYDGPGSDQDRGR